MLTKHFQEKKYIFQFGFNVAHLFVTVSNEFKSSKLLHPKFYSYCQFCLFLIFLRFCFSNGVQFSIPQGCNYVFIETPIKKMNGKFRYPKSCYWKLFRTVDKFVLSEF